jgi:hypothetical protein
VTVIDPGVPPDRPGLPDDFPLDQVTSLVWHAADHVAGYCRSRGVASPAEYLALEYVSDAIVGLLAALDVFDPAGADRRAHACSTGCPFKVLH